LSLPGACAIFSKREHAARFFAELEASIEVGLPRFVKDDAFLEYGILAHGFLRLGCGLSR
jgi:hypothetical protein